MEAVDKAEKTATTKKKASGSKTVKTDKASEAAKVSKKAAAAKPAKTVKTGKASETAKVTIKTTGTKSAKTGKTGKSATSARTAKTAKSKKSVKTGTKVKSAATGKIKDGSDNKAKKSRSLIIVESPAKARSLEKFSHGHYIVKASMGHVRDLPKSRIGVDTDNEYLPKYVTIRGKKNILDDLRKSAKNAPKIFLASDPDREGEAIAWHLAKILKVEDPLRIEMHEITKDAFKNAIENTRSINMDLVNAQQARRILDRLVGYNLSPLLWRKITGGLSAGRVQSVTVKLICDRQREIDAFQPEEYWTIGVLASRLQQSKKDAFEANLLKNNDKKIDISDKESSDKILKDLKNEMFIVKSVTIKDQKKNPYPPFKTSTLQQDAHRKLGYRARKTMKLAQELYEGIEVGSAGPTGLITYMRTDSVRLSPASIAEADEFIRETFGEEYRSKGRVFSGKSKGKIQDAHEAIRPTSAFRTPEIMKQYLKRDQLRLYTLIWERFIASQMAACVMENISVDITAGDYLFRATDSQVKFPGFTKIYGNNGKREKNPIPSLEVNEELKIHEYLPKQHFTQPPPAYTEASLIKTLEEKGIGRPSTYAPIVDTIQARGYVILEEKKFKPTDLGYKVTDMLAEFFPDILNVDFTAGMETNLDKVEEGNENWVEIIDKFYKPFAITLSDADEKIPKVNMEPEPAGFNCDKCDSPMIIKRGRFGKFIACSAYPECKNTKPFLEEIGVPCPQEGCDGQIIQKRSRKGKTFYGCSNFPKCTFASWHKPLNETCSRCGKPLVLRFSKQGRAFKTCMDQSCQKKKQEENPETGQEMNQEKQA